MAYVYRHIRLDKNEPFYIGIGSDNRYKRARTYSGRNRIWRRIANKTKWEVEILFDNLNLSFAKEKEKEFIAMYGRIDNGSGILANLSAGGDGMFDVSISVRKRLSLLNKGDKNSFYGKKHTEESRKKISLSKVGLIRQPLSQKTKDKISEKNKGRSTWIKGKKNPKASLKMAGKNHRTYRGIVYGFKASGEYIGSFECIRDAANFTNSKSTNEIRRVILGERRHVGGYIFSYNKDIVISPIKDLKSGIFICKKVFNLQTGIFYDSIKEASFSSNISYRNLCRYLDGTRVNKSSFILC